jgi:hypothetical protein
MSNFMKIRSLGTEFYADGWTDRRNGAESLSSKFCQRA